jgi:hypothetical protein
MMLMPSGNANLLAYLFTKAEGSHPQCEICRKERNRMHAKLTRDRKKMFTSRLQQMISALERQNQGMRNRLQMQIQSSRSEPINPHLVAPPVSAPSVPPQAMNLPHHMPMPMPPSSSFIHMNHMAQMGHHMPRVALAHHQGYAPAMPVFLPHHYANPNLLQSLGLPSNFNLSQAIAIAPPMNVNAYAPLALKRKVHETMPSFSSSSSNQHDAEVSFSMQARNE